MEGMGLKDARKDQEYCSPSKSPGGQKGWLRQGKGQEVWLEITRFYLHYPFFLAILLSRLDSC